MIPSSPGSDVSNQVVCTYLANNLVVLEHAPGNIDTVIIPVGPRHMLVDISVYTRHDDRRWVPSSPTMEIRCGGVSRGATGSSLRMAQETVE